MCLKCRNEVVCNFCGYKINGLTLPAVLIKLLSSGGKKTPQTNINTSSIELYIYTSDEAGTALAGVLPV